VKTYYDLLELPRTSSADEIKTAFRREIAKYHPDKVQHLGEEFQQIAVVKAAELTQAYKTLSDPAARADYDAQLGEEGRPPASGAAPSPAGSYQTAEPGHARPAEPGHARAEPGGESAGEPQPAGGSSFFAQERAGALDLVRKATLARFRQALSNEFNEYEERRSAGFEVVCLPKPTGLFKMRQLPGILGRFLSHVDAATVAETWGLTAKITKDVQRDVCVFVMAPVLAPAGELAKAIAAQRRKPIPGGAKLVLIPVNTQTWNAHVPTDAPPVVKALLTRLKSA
jgi:hypothetical protein